MLAEYEKWIREYFGVSNDETGIGEYMETLYVWLFIFAGATMIVVGICLLASERELRKQRREIDALRRNQQPSQPQGFEKHQSAELLMTRNKELTEKISSLSSELEESKRIMEDLQSERHHRVSYSELQQQLQASQGTIKKLEAEQLRLAGVNFENQQLCDEIANLKNQLQASEVQLSESAWQNREAERYAQLQKILRSCLDGWKLDLRPDGRLRFGLV